MVQKKESEDAKTEMNLQFAEKPQPTKKTYCPPELTEYGNLSKLTQGQTGSLFDGGSGMAMAPMM